MKLSLKAFRANKNLSQTEVAKMIGITKETLSNWERYKTYPDVMALKKLCDIYECEMDNIFLPDELAESD